MWRTFSNSTIPGTEAGWGTKVHVYQLRQRLLSNERIIFMEFVHAQNPPKVSHISQLPLSSLSLPGKQPGFSFHGEESNLTHAVVSDDQLSNVHCSISCSSPNFETKRLSGRGKHTGSWSLQKNANCTKPSFVSTSLSSSVLLLLSVLRYPLWRTHPCRSAGISDGVTHLLFF